MNNYFLWIIHNWSLRERKFIETITQLKNSAIKKWLKVKTIKNNEVLALIKLNNSSLIWSHSKNKPDFVIFWDKDVRLARHLERMWFKLFNSSKAIEICDDKSLTQQVLSDNNILMPKTLTSPLIFNESLNINNDYINSIEKEFKYPFVIKEVYWAFGLQVYLIKNKNNLLKIIKQIWIKPYIIQEFIEKSKWRSIRLNVVGNKVVASMLRISKTDFITSASMGCDIYNYEPNKKQINLAIKCTKLIWVDFAWVDLLFWDDDEPIVCEVNSNAQMKNILNCTWINVADYIIGYIINIIDCKLSKGFNRN